jgi:hypothetical protein
MSFDDYIKRITKDDQAILEELSVDHDLWGDAPLTESPSN